MHLQTTEKPRDNFPHIPNVTTFLILLQIPKALPPCADLDLFYIPLSTLVPNFPLSLRATKAAATEDSCNPQPIPTTTESNPQTFK